MLQIKECIDSLSIPKIRGIFHIKCLGIRYPLFCSVESPTLLQFKIDNFVVMLLTGCAVFVFFTIPIFWSALLFRFPAASAVLYACQKVFCVRTASAKSSCLHRALSRRVLRDHKNVIISVLWHIWKPLDPNDEATSSLTWSYLCYHQRQ